MPNFPEIKNMIAARLTVEEIFDILEWDMHDFVEVISDYIEERQEDFEDACR